MKELDQLQKDQTEIHAQAEIRKDQVYGGTLILKPGLKLWEIPMHGDPETIKAKDITPKTAAVNLIAAVSTKATDMIKNRIEHKAEMKVNHFYCTAVNEKNAMRKYIRFRLHQYMKRKSQ